MIHSSRDLFRVGFFCLYCFVLTKDARASSIDVVTYFSDPQGLALANAAQDNDVSLIRHLSAAGVDVNFKGRSNLTPLLVALVHRSKKAYETLLELGADPNVQFSETGGCALSSAAAIEESYFLKQALAHGGNPNLVNPRTGLTPIWGSVEQILPENVKILAVAGANVNFPNSDGVTPMMIASGGNRYDLVLILLDLGADPRRRNHWGNSVLWYIRHTRTDPNSKFFKWKEEVIARIRALGVDTEQAP
jgi:ankyrin repeat protein